MDERVFTDLCKRVVVNYVNECLTDAKITEKNVFVVWSSKILQNNKAILSTDLPDGMMYEVTCNGDKGEIYLDAYKKWQNRGYKLNNNSDDGKPDKAEAPDAEEPECESSSKENA